MSSNCESDDITGLLDSSATIRSYLNVLKDGSSTNMNLSTVRSLALKTIADPQIFCGFDELKNCCSQLVSPQGQNSTSCVSDSLFNTLDLFSFGTIKDYLKQVEAKKDQADEYYLPLTAPALAKLRQLTVLTCVQNSCLEGKTFISYDVVAEALGLMTDVMQDENSPSDFTSSTAIRQVEDALIQCLYSNVLKGKLCQKTRTFGWKGECLPVVLSRDVRVTHVQNLLSQLLGLEQRLEQSSMEVFQAQQNVTQGLESAEKYWKTVKKNKKKTQEESISKPGGLNSGASAARAFFGETFGGGASINNPRRSSKRSRGGMSGNYQISAGKRI